jgi:hypothetical protein
MPADMVGWSLCWSHFAPTAKSFVASAEPAENVGSSVCWGSNRADRESLARSHRLVGSVTSALPLGGWIE